MFFMRKTREPPPRVAAPGEIAPSFLRKPVGLFLSGFVW
jgi:hypothetical protein